MSKRIEPALFSVFEENLVLECTVKRTLGFWHAARGRETGNYIISFQAIAYILGPKKLGTPNHELG